MSPLDFARRLVDMGVPVFAAQPDPDGRTPSGRATGYTLPSQWQRFTADPKRLEVWREGWALCAIGGHGIDFIDVDPRNGGHDAARELRAAGTWPREYAVVTTPSGGGHFYVASLGISKTKRAGIDLQGGSPDGPESGRGFVFLPGTVRSSKATGRPEPYTLLVDALDTFGQDDTSGAPFRSWVTAARPAESGSSPAADTGTPIPAGEQDDTLARYASSLAARGLDFETVVLLTVRRGGDCVPSWASGMKPGDETLEEAARNRWVPSAMKKFSREWIDTDALVWPAYDAAVEALDAAPSGVAPPDPGRYACIDWDSLWGEPDDDDWLLRPLIPSGRSIALYSAPKVGKSILILEVACALARGVPVLEMTPDEPVVVLVVDYENHPRGDVRRRLRDAGLGPGDLGNLRYLSFPALPPLDVEAGGAHLLAVAQREGAGVVIIDTVVRTIEGEENSNDTWTKFYNYTGKLLKAAGIAYVRLDHSGKDEARGMRGASNKSSDVDMVWRLSRTTEDGVSPEEFILQCEAPRVYLPDNERAIAFRRMVGPLRHERISLPNKLAAEAAKLRAIWVAMDEAGVSINPCDEKGVPLGVRKIADQMRAACGVEGRHEQLAGVARVRWAASHNAFATRPDWAPEITEEAV